MTRAVDRGKAGDPPNGDAPKRRRAPSSGGAVVPMHGFHHTDLGNSERVVNQHAQEMRYVWDTGQWMTWDGTRWAADPDGAAVLHQVIGTVRSMYRAASDPDTPEDRKRLAEWAMASESRPRLEAAVRLASSHQVVRVGVKDLDQNPALLAVTNGVVDLATGELRAPNPAELITQQVTTSYDPAAKCPLWVATLNRILPDPEVRAFLQRAIGYSLTGYTREQVMFLCEGRGANGKSVVVETLMALLGGYAQKAPSDLLLARASGSDLSNDVARLRGARFAAAVETDENRRLAEARVKELTGADTVTARFLHREFFEFKPVCKLWFVTNHRPKISGTDDGIWRRLLTIPFGEYIGPAERDTALGEKLLGELPGILAWAIRGCLDWQRQGLNPPAAVLDAAVQYRQEQDVLGGFIAERCVVREGISAAASGLYKEYQDWCTENGHSPYSQTSFGIKLSERGFVREKKGTITWRKIGLRAQFGNWDDEPAASDVQAESTAKPPTVCRACGETCDPVCNGLHVNCVDPTDPPEPPDDGPDDQGPDSGPGPDDPGPGLDDPGPGPDDPGPVPPAPTPSEAAETAAEPMLAASLDDEPGPVVTSRRRRPWTAKSTAYVGWSTGKGVDDSDAEVTVPARARVGAFLAALPADTERVILVGAMPGKTGPGLQDWVTDELPVGWSVAPSGHYLDPDALAARYSRPEGGEVHVHRLESWVRDSGGAIRPATAAAAFRLFREGLAAVFGRRRIIPGQPFEADRPELAPAVLSSPASTGRELLLRSLPAEHGYPVLSDEQLEILHHSTGQGRNELLTSDPEQYPAGELSGLYGYDMRWSYAALCRGITGSGPAILDNRSEFLGYSPARYEVEFRVPADWSHLGLLGVSGQGWPSEPGTRWRTWADGRELRLADRWGWKIGTDVQITRRLRYTTDKSTPLRTWADKLTEVRETWLPAQQAPAPVIKLAQDITRTVLLASLGALQGRRQKVTHSIPQARAAEIPAGATPHLAGGMLVWESETSAGWREMVHPEWVGQVWAEQRCRLMDTGPNAAQPNVGALHIPRAELVALRTDAVYSTTDPGWVDNGKVGAFRPQLALSGPVPTPRELADLLKLRAKG